MIYKGDSREVLGSIASGSVDLVATDPPYGISFMGREWDKALPDKGVWAECLRVLKPGAFAFVMSIPRADCLSRMVISLEDVGFRVNFTPIYWCYASGFPKAQNIGKAVDKRNGRVADEYKELGEHLRRMRGDRPQKDISKFFPSRAGGLTGCVANWELGFNVPTKEQWVILKRELGLGNRFDELIEREEAEREVVGKKQWNNSAHHFIPGEDHTERVQLDETLPATPQAKVLDGSYGGFQVKPAVEVIIVAMKPLSEKTYVEQALKNGKGVTWLDDCRIPYESEGDKTFGTRSITNGWQWEKGKVEPMTPSPQGRFPANLCCSSGIDVNIEALLEARRNLTEDNQPSETLQYTLDYYGINLDEFKAMTDEQVVGMVKRFSDVLNDGRVRTSGARTRDYKVKNKSNSLGVFHTMTSRCGSSSGSFSRYFDLDKWWAERIKLLPASVQKTFPFLIVPKASKSEKNKGCEGLPEKFLATMGDGIGEREHNPQEKTAWVKNNHPTVKPLKLMSYLITLGSRPGDTVLDPFLGSGTTALASQLLGRECIGIELNADYCEIAAKRCGQNAVKGGASGQEEAG